MKLSSRIWWWHFEVFRLGEKYNVFKCIWNLVIWEIRFVIINQDIDLYLSTSFKLSEIRSISTFLCGSEVFVSFELFSSSRKSKLLNLFLLMGKTLSGALDWKGTYFVEWFILIRGIASEFLLIPYIYYLVDIFC